MKTQQGFGKILLIIIIGGGLFLYFYKDAEGVSYYQKIVDMINGGKDKVTGSIDSYKDTMQNRDKEIVENLE